MAEETEEQKRERLPIIILATNGVHGEIDGYASRLFEGIGLVRGRDYDIYSIPPSMAEVVPVPIIRVNRENSWGLREERFYGKEGIDALVDEIRKRKVA